MRNTIRAMACAVALAVAASGILALSGCGSQNKPEGVVLSFMSALEKGQAEEAFTLSGMSVPSGADTALLTDAVYGAAADRPTGAKVVSAQTSDDSHATVVITYALAGKTLGATFTVSLVTPATGKSKVWQIDPQPFGDTFAAAYDDMVGNLSLSLDPWYKDGELTVDGAAVHLPASSSSSAKELVFPGTYTFEVASTTLLPSLSVTWSTDTMANESHSSSVSLARSLGGAATAAVSAAYLTAFDGCVATQPQVEGVITAEDPVPSAGAGDGSCAFLTAIVTQVEQDIKNMKLASNQSALVDSHVCLYIPNETLSNIAYQTTTPPSDFTLTKGENGSGYSITPSAGSILVTATITITYVVAISSWASANYSGCDHGPIPASQQTGFSQSYDAAPQATFTTDGETVTIGPF